MTVSLLGVASYLPETIVDNAFFGGQTGSGMFKGARERRHVAEHESSVDMIERAAKKLEESLGLSLPRDVDLLLTNVTCPDMPFTGSGAEVVHRLGLRPKFVLDLHNSGCISFLFMIEAARGLMASTGARTALLCNVQNAAGRVFRDPQNRARPQSAVPGDGCGVGYIAASEASPVRSLVTRSFGEFAEDMKVVCDSGEPWWAPRATPLYIDFTESRVASVVSRGNRLVPELIREAAREAGLRTRDIDVLVTNQPNPNFLRNWREALELPKEKQVETYEEHGNLFGAAVPIAIERALELGTLTNGKRLAIGGFAHAGDYAAGAIVHWYPG